MEQYCKSDQYYNLAFLSGQLKGYSLEEDLLKVSREIHEKTLK